MKQIQESWGATTGQAAVSGKWSVRKRGKVVTPPDSYEGEPDQGSEDYEGVTTLNMGAESHNGRQRGFAGMMMALFGVVRRALGKGA